MYFSNLMISHLDPDSSSVCISALPWQHPMYTGLKHNMKRRYRKLWKVCTHVRIVYENVYATNRWYVNDQLHRDNDKPAIVYANGRKAWYKNGQRHRDDDKPAINGADGIKYWYKNDQLHREHDKPAVEYKNGDKEWYKNGQLHRDHDMPAIEDANGDKAWYKNGQEYYPKNHLLQMVIKNGTRMINNIRLTMVNVSISKQCTCQI